MLPFAALNLAGLVVRNALRNRRRTALTVLSVAVSLFLFVSLRTLLTELEGDSLLTRQSSLRLITRHAISLEVALPIAWKQRIARLDGIDWVTEYQWFPTWFRDPSNILLVFFVDPAIAGLDPEYVWAPGAVEAFKADRTCVVVPEKMMERFDWKVGDRVTFVGTALPFDIPTRICGTYTGPAQSSPLGHYTYFNELKRAWMPDRADRVTSFYIKVKTVDDAARVTEQIDAMFANTEAATHTESEKGFILSFTAMLGNVRMFITFIAFAVIFAIVLVTMNTMAMAVRERTTEIAVLKTLGFGRALVLALVTAESLLLSLFGAALGIATTLVLFRVIDIYQWTEGIIQHFVVRAGTLYEGVTVAIVMGVVSALLPGWHAARSSIVKALREVR